MKKITARMVHDGARPEDGALLKNVADQIAGRTICAFGEACAWPTPGFVLEIRRRVLGAHTEGKETKGRCRVSELV